MKLSSSRRTVRLPVTVVEQRMWRWCFIRTCFYVFINKTFLPENISSERGRNSFYSEKFRLPSVSQCFFLSITMYIRTYVRVFLSWNSFELATTGWNKRNNGESTFCKFLSRFARFFFFFFLEKVIYKVAKRRIFYKYSKFIYSTQHVW